MSDPELSRLVADLFPELFQSNISQVNNGTNASLNHLESIAYDVLNRRFVRSGSGGPIQSPHVIPSNETRARVPVTESPVLPEDRTSLPRREVTYPEFDQLMQLYHRNVFEYNRTTQSIINEISSNQSGSGLQARTAREIREISSVSHAFNQNMQEYHQITDNCLDLLRDMYFSQNSHNRYANRYVDSNTNIGAGNNVNANNRTNAGVGGNVNPPSNANFIPITPTTTTISPPRTLFSYTLFPYVSQGTAAVGQGTGQRMEETPPLLTAQQMRDSTEEYTYSSDTTQTVIPVCPISLEDFQEGDSITRIRECLHEFKTPHLNRWFLRSSRCPVCRWNLLSMPSIRSNRSRSNSQLSVPSINNGPINIAPLTSVSGQGATRNVSLHTGREAHNGVSSWAPTEPLTEGSLIQPNIDASASSIVTLPARLQDILADPSLNQISQRLFSNIFQNMLMNTTDAPPNITSLIEGGSDTSMNFQSLFGNGMESFINSIDITYTIDYDSSATEIDG